MGTSCVGAGTLWGLWPLLGGENGFGSVCFGPAGEGRGCRLSVSSALNSSHPLARYLYFPPSPSPCCPSPPPRAISALPKWVSCRVLLYETLGWVSKRRGEGFQHPAQPAVPVNEVTEVAGICRPSEGSTDRAEMTLELLLTTSVPLTEGMSWGPGTIAVVHAALPSRENRPQVSTVP